MSSGFSILFSAKNLTISPLAILHRVPFSIGFPFFISEKEQVINFIPLEDGRKSVIHLLYSFDAKLIQNGKQYEEEPNYEADYPEVQTDLSVGVTTEGIITFQPIEEAPFQIILPAYSDNFSENIADYTFDITIQ